MPDGRETATEFRDDFQCSGSSLIRGRVELVPEIIVSMEATGIASMETTNMASVEATIMAFMRITSL